jgi:hypothetical protein
MIRRSHVRLEKERKAAEIATLAENEKFLADVNKRAQEITTGKAWVSYLNLLMKSHLSDQIRTVYKVVVTFSRCFRQFTTDDLSMSCHPRGALFQTAYESFERNLDAIHTPLHPFPEKHQWLIPHLEKECRDVLKVMDEMIWNTTSKTPFVLTHQNRMLRMKGEAFVKQPVYEELVQWTMHPRHFEDGWFADHGFLDEEGVLAF